MNYLTFQKEFKKFGVFSLIDIVKQYPDFDSRRLVEWQMKGYIKKIRRGYYCFEDYIKNEQFLYFTANKIYSPSYISLESALTYYSFIPERVFLFSSVSSKNTCDYETPLGFFEYKHVKPSLFFAYKLISLDNITIKMAEPEKAILDFFYLKKINSIENIEAMRFNKYQIKDVIDFEIMGKYLRIFNSNILNQRIQLFKKIIDA